MARNYWRQSYADIERGLFLSATARAQALWGWLRRVRGSSNSGGPLAGTSPAHGRHHWSTALPAQSREDNNEGIAQRLRHWVRAPKRSRPSRAAATAYSAGQRSRSVRASSQRAVDRPGPDPATRNGGSRHGMISGLDSKRSRSCQIPAVFWARNWPIAPYEGLKATAMMEAFSCVGAGRRPRHCHVTASLEPECSGAGSAAMT